MLRVLKQFVLTTLFAVFSSQASAMFIQPDWLDPTQPGVGTNRYAYSFNDPVNLRDPGGNDIDDDPRLHSTDRDEYETATGQLGQSVDEARARGESERLTEMLSQSVFGKPYDDLNTFEKLQVNAAVLSNANPAMGVVSPGFGMVASVASGAGPGQDGMVALESRSSILTRIWQATKSRSAVERAMDHWTKHRREFPEYNNALEYVRGG